MGTLSHVSADSGPTTSALVRTAITGVDAGLVVTSEQWNRVVVVGKPDSTSTTDGYPAYAVVDSIHQRTIAQGTVAQPIESLGVDEHRGYAYFTTSGHVYPAGGGMPIYNITLYKISLRTGRMLWHRSFPTTDIEPMTTLTVDGVTGRVFISQGTVSDFRLLMVDPHTMAVQSQKLDTRVDQVFVDSARHRVVLSFYHHYDPDSTTLMGFDTRTERRVWSKTLTYIADALVFNRRARQVWVFAPGGHITGVDAATGHTMSQMHMAYPQPAWHKDGVAVDGLHNLAYALWYGDSASCNVDRADPRTGLRTTFFAYACNGYATTLIGVDEQHGHLLVGGNSTLSVLDATTGAAVETVEGIPAFTYPHSWANSIVFSSGGHTWITFPDEVPHQNDETGATTAGAIVFVRV